ncbi:MAG TPA: alpha-isopropylmalate synthase regulatory domain-containing protein, partial [Candidatus Sumerlaeota bacterium]|nr:alpha-isopropylmalate synthase regulatory domain-containing protein [Candidatus Sumerlaeota bacterium]
EGMVMGKHSGRAALAARLEQLGIKGLSPEDITAAYERFKKLCDQKKTVYDEDLLAIVEDQVSLQRAIYRLVDLEASTSMRGGPRVRVAIAVGDAGEQHEALCTEGDGQVDALYRALDQLTPHTIKLLEYGIESVTEGKDALGRVMVKMNIDGDEVRGTGVATDVIVASAHAYLNALNRFEMLKEISERAASTATP